VTRYVAWTVLLVVSAFGCEARVTTIATLNHDAGEPAQAASVYIEAESGDLSGGFSIAADADASEGQFLAPPAMITSDDTPGAARARWSFSVAATETFVIWGRIRSPLVSSNRFWFRVDDGPWYKWRITVGDIWYWDRLHDDAAYGTALMFPLDAGQHSLTFANCVPGAELDRLYITSESAAPSGNDTTCTPPHSIELAGQCHPSCGSHGVTTCGDDVCRGKPALESYDCSVCCLVAP
jgi:hypothetical protein